MTSTIEQTASRLIACVRSLESVAVAWSGGVDSAVVGKAAVLALGDRAVAVTAVSPSLPHSERTIAQSEAQAVGIRHLEIHTNEFSRDEYRRNAGDRCFFCKDTLYTFMTSQLDELNVRHIVNGANLDDTGDHRPGMQAADQHAIRSPLIEEGIDKNTVRELARFWKLSVSEKPASPCLSSRIAYGVEVTPERVGRVEQAEAFIREKTGIEVLRVRLEAGDLARIEVPLNFLPSMLGYSTRTAVVEKLLSLGFRNVTIDLQGFRSGSLNEALVELRT